MMQAVKVDCGGMRQRYAATVLGLLLLIIGIPAALLLVPHSQEMTLHAARVTGRANLHRSAASVAVLALYLLHATRSKSVSLLTWRGQIVAI
jgi:hypothetical protein